MKPSTQIYRRSTADVPQRVAITSASLATNNHKPSLSNDNQCVLV